MHIPDGFLSPETCAAMYAAMVPAWWLSGKRLAAKVSSAVIPFLSLGSAFAFVVMSLQLPVPNGTSAHGVGGTFIALAAGPEAAVVTVSVALAVQALFFGDGGVLTYGANAFSAALSGPMTGYLLFRVLRGWLRFREDAAAAVAGFVGVNVTGAVAALQLGLQPLLFRTADGLALYSPFGLREVLPAMVIAHALVAGPVEAALTSFGLRFLRTESWRGPMAWKKNRPGLVWLAAVAGLALLVPLSTMAPRAWGEWTALEVGQMVGYLPSGLVQLEAVWRAPWQEVESSLPGLVGTGPAALIAVAVGACIVAGASSLVLWLIHRRRLSVGGL